jgi:glycosyltransferase involved in cell wall biosynthesis
MKRNTWVVIPARNESKNIAAVLLVVKKYSEKVVVVDDGSSDATAEKAEKAGVEVLRHIINMGKGAALKTGCDYAVEHGAERIVVMDADGQHDPAEIPKFLSALDSAEIALGVRKLNYRMPLVFRVGNWFINKLTGILFGVKINDTQCGFRAFTRQAYRKVRWNALDYSMESEMIANVGRKHINYSEIPIQTIYADHYKGTTVLDGIRIVANMLFWRLRG